MRYFLFASAVVFVSSVKITPCENERLKATCGRTNKGNLCSGSLISQRHVITAAHCVARVHHVNETEHCVGKKPSQVLRVDVGNLTRYSVFVGSGCSHPEKCHKRRNVLKVTPHPLYDNDCFKQKDIAIIEFDENLIESEATPICVANQVTKVHKVLYAAGQGVDPTLQKNRLGKGIQVVTLGYEFLVKEQGAIATRNATAGVAAGDSGGPLFQFKDNGRAVLLGPCSRKVHYHTKKNKQHTVTITRDLFTDIREETKWVCEETGVCPDSSKLSPEELRKCKN